MIRVTIFNEFIHEKEMECVKAIYPLGMHMTLKEVLEDDNITVNTVTLDDEECGLTDEVLKNTDVLMWWGHGAHHMVPDEVAQRVQREVLKGMGAIFLHSAHHSKPFRMLMGTTANLSWRENADWENLWVVKPSHPIAKGVGPFIRIPNDEVYCEPFDIPEPDELVFIGNYEGGEAFRSGCCFKRGNGNIFYFQPGHETFPVFKQPEVITILKNAIKWANPNYRVDALECPHIEDKDRANRPV